MNTMKTTLSRCPESSCWRGAVTLVTGATGGIGNATVTLLAGLGATVIATAPAEQLPQASDLPENIRFTPLDVADPLAWQILAEKIEREFGVLHFLVNNAGIYFESPIQESAHEAALEVVQVNLMGTVSGIRSLHGLLVAGSPSSIVNVSSAAGLRATPGAAVYSATKWAVRGLTKSLAHEFGRDGIRVNAVLPGLIDTPMAGKNSFETNQRRIGATPLGRIGTALEVARGIVFLGSDHASFITGADLSVDGGIGA